MTFPSPPWQPSSMQMYRKDNTYFYSAGPWIYNDLDPYRGVIQADLTPDGLGTAPRRICLSNWNGFELIPPETTKFKVFSHLYRGVSAAGGYADVSAIAYLPGHQTEGDYNSFAVLGMSNRQSGPVGEFVESRSDGIEFPNLTEGNDFGVFYWKHRGTTPLGASMMLRLVSFDVPTGYVLPAVWPVEILPPSSSLLLNFDTNYSDSSPVAHVTVPHNLTLDGAGAAIFDGAAGFLSFDGSDSSMILDSDFTIEVIISTTNKSLHGGTQRRILSFGGPPNAGDPPRIAIYIDPNTGGAGILNEFVSVLKTGSINVASGAQSTVRWTRSGGVNMLTINGAQDGATFNDQTTWMASTTAEIGRLHGQTIGFFDGKIYNIKIVKGSASG